MQKKNILFFTYAGVGGAERVTVTIAKKLRDAGNNVKIVLVYKKNECKLLKFIPSDIPVIHCPVINIWACVTFRLAFILYKEKCDTVFSSNTTLNFRVINAAKIVGVKNIIVRNQNMIQTFPLLSRIGIKFFYRNASHIILQTEEMKEQFFRFLPNFPKEKTHAIVNPIDVSTIDEKVKACENPYDNNFINYAYVGRISYTKGLDVLFDSFRLVKNRIKNARLHIIGEYSEVDSYYQKLLIQIKNLNLSDAVIFHGFQDNPYRFIKYANCFTLASRIEGLPNVVLEAMYLRVPTVVTRSVPIVERLVPSDRGIVVDVENVSDLAEAMIQILNFKIDSSYEYESEGFIELF